MKKVFLVKKDVLEKKGFSAIMYQNTGQFLDLENV